MANPGKVFEEDFKKSFLFLNNVSIDRLYDVMGGRKGLNTICDFIVYNRPYQYYFELKSYQGDSIPIDAITENQFKGLIAKAFVSGVRAGVLLQYRLPNGEAETWYVNIFEVNLLKQSGAKYLKLDKVREIGVQLHGIRKRTRYEYSVFKLLIDIVEGKK